jgi:hypothetical protein
MVRLALSRGVLVPKHFQHSPAQVNGPRQIGHEMGHAVIEAG